MAVSINEIPFNLIPEELAFDRNSYIRPIFDAILEILYQIKMSIGGDEGVIPISSGGTGWTTASEARTNLGLAIGSDIQAWDADLDQLAAIAAADDDTIVQVG